MLVMVCAVGYAQHQKQKSSGRRSKNEKMIEWQAHYEELKADRDAVEHQAGETARQLSRAEKQLKESQDALSTSKHEV